MWCEDDNSRWCCYFDRMPSPTQMTTAYFSWRRRPRHLWTWMRYSWLSVGKSWHFIPRLCVYRVVNRESSVNLTGISVKALSRLTELLVSAEVRWIIIYLFITYSHSKWKVAGFLLFCLVLFRPTAKRLPKSEPQAAGTNSGRNRGVDLTEAAQPAKAPCCSN